MNDGGSQGQQFTLTASKGMGGSRTAIINGQTVWSEGDKIYVSGDDGRVTGVLTLNPESIKDDPTKGTFTGFVFGDPEKLEYSVFPAPTNGTIIDLSTIEGASQLNAPMIGAIEQNPIDGTDVHFKNACGVLPLSLNGFQKENLIIAAKDNNGNEVVLAAKTDVTDIEWKNVEGKNVPVLKFEQTTANTITINNAKGGDMYIPYYIVNADKVNLGNITFTANGLVVNENANLKGKDGNAAYVGKIISTTAKTHTKTEGGVKENQQIQSGLKPGEEKPTAVPDINLFDKAINNAQSQVTPGETQYFNVSALVTQERTGEDGNKETETVVAEAIEVTLPKVEAPTTEGEQPTEKSVEISFTNVTSSTTITIKEDSESTNPASIDNLTVVLPSGTTKEEAKEQVVIEMPNTTVTVKSADGNVLLIDEAVATTGENTFIISEDVFINGLWVRKGNVDVYGKVKNWIKRHNENRDDVTTITLYGNATVGNLQELENDSKFIVKRGGAEEPEVPHVSTLEELQTAIASGATNIILTKTITLTDDTSLNLNGKTLTLSENFEWVGNAAIVSNGYALTINGPIEGCQKTVEDKYLISVKGATNAGLTNGALITNGVENAIYLYDTKSLNINNSSISALNGFAVDVMAHTKAVQVNLGGVNAVGIKGKIGFCNDYSAVGSRLTVGEGSNIQGKLVTSGSNLDGLVISVEAGVVINGEGWPVPLVGHPVASLAELKEALLDNTITDIVLTKPIPLSEDINLGEKVIKLSNTFFDDNNTDAAIVVEGNISISGWKGTAKITGIATRKDRYIIRINSNVNFNGVIVEAEGKLSALCVQDARLSTGNRTNIISEEGYALDMIAMNGCADAYLKDKTVVKGGVHYLLESGKECTFNVNDSSIESDFSCGNNLNLLKVVKENNGTIIGAGWPNSSQGGDTGGKDFEFGQVW